MTIEQIQRLATAYAGHTGLKLSTVGAYAAGDGKFFKRLAEGRECYPRTLKKVAAWLDEKWPTDLEWPTGVPRPAPSEVSSKTKRGAA